MSVIDTKKQTVVAELVAKFGTTVNRTDVVSVCQKHGVSWGFLTGTKVGRGTYDISALVGSASIPVASKPELTDEEILTSQRRKFRTLDRMAQGVVRKQVRSMVVSGPAGIGKTYTIEGILENAANDETIQYTGVRGFIKATGLYKLLWENREENQVILLDDARVRQVISSWRGVNPVMHFSQSREDVLVDHDPNVLPDMNTLLSQGHCKQKLRAHSEFLWNNAANQWARSFFGSFSIQTEAKAKNLASAQLAAVIN